MPSPTPAWAVMGKGGDIECRCVFLGEHDARNLLSYVDESVVPVVIVDKAEWERMKAIATEAEHMLDSLDNAVGADDWSTSDLRERLAERLKGAGE